MAGSELKEGYYKKREVTEDELWAAIACVFTTSSRNDSSYKYVFLKSILANLENVNSDLILNFDQLFTTFTKLYWNLVLKYNLNQKFAVVDKRKTMIETILSDALNKYNAGEFISFEELPIKARNDIVHQVKMKCKTYVIGALFEDTKRLFYSFSKKEEWIQFNPEMYKFVCKRKNDIEKLTNFELAYFLEKVNKGHNANDILSRCILNDGPSYVQNIEKTIVNETSQKKQQPSINIKNTPVSTSYNEEDDSYDIDEEVKILLDDPIELIKLLKQRRGIL